MDKQEVKEEHKSSELPAEVRGAIRRRQMQAARARMMADVPTADVVVTNPTHFAVALKYDGEKAAPEVVAKGPDLIALKIRETRRRAAACPVDRRPAARALAARGGRGRPARSPRSSTRPSRGARLRLPHGPPEGLSHERRVRSRS